MKKVLVGLAAVVAVVGLVSRARRMHERLREHSRQMAAHCREMAAACRRMTVTAGD